MHGPEQGNNEPLQLRANIRRRPRILHIGPLEYQGPEYQVAQLLQCGRHLQASRVLVQHARLQDVPRRLLSISDAGSGGVRHRMKRDVRSHRLFVILRLLFQDYHYHYTYIK